MAKHTNSKYILCKADVTHVQKHNIHLLNSLYEKEKSFENIIAILLDAVIILIIIFV